MKFANDDMPYLAMCCQIQNQAAAEVWEAGHPQLATILHLGMVLEHVFLGHFARS